MTTQIYLEKNIEDQATGADVKYHEITAYSVDLTAKTSTATVTSYCSLKARQSGKQPIGLPIIINLQGIPQGNDTLNWLYQQITAAAPEDYVEPEEKYYGWVNPYTFAGGKIKTAELL